MHRVPADLLFNGVLIIAAMFAVAVLSWALHRLSEYAETRVPRYLQPLEDTYASFHRFLAAVRAAAARRVH